MKISKGVLMSIDSMAKTKSNYSPTPIQICGALAASTMSKRKFIFPVCGISCLLMGYFWARTFKVITFPRSDKLTPLAMKKFHP